jgi:DNA-binding NarL/FixJ family response regulator
MIEENHIKLRILIVDDLEYMRKLVWQFLSKNEDVTVVGEASSGDEAIQKTQQYHPDVILLDMNIPNISGIEVAKKIRLVEPAVRIYFFSAYDIEDFKNLVHDYIADGFIQKSSLKDELQQMVQVELERKKSQSK